MELKDIILIVLAFLGWSWGIIQYFINCKLQREEKITDRRFDVYSGYMKKADELMNNIRTDPNMIYGIATDFYKQILTGDEDQINDALIKFNEKLQEFVKKASEPLMILRQELSTLLLVCSKELRPMIEQYRFLATDFNNEFQNVLSTISTNDAQKMQEKLTTMGHDTRWRQFETLNEDILQLMRKELGYDK
ncbi:hypothetical protein DSECCO2_107190 [anaerobic digester metagenome]